MAKRINLDPRDPKNSLMPQYLLDRIDVQHNKPGKTHEFWEGQVMDAEGNTHYFDDEGFLHSKAEDENAAFISTDLRTTAWFYHGKPHRHKFGWALIVQLPDRIRRERWYHGVCTYIEDTVFTTEEELRRYHDGVIPEGVEIMS